MSTGNKVTKLVIKDMFGISEFAHDGKDIEIGGHTGAGKTSVLDAIIFALTNQSERKHIIHKGSKEGEVYIEFDNGLSINRKEREGKSGYKSVKTNGHEVGSPESFLRDLFSPLQLNPMKFISMSEKEQNAMLLDMIAFDWDMSTIKEWFGEIPAWVDYQKNILSVLQEIQSEKGDYFTLRQDINRDARNKKAMIQEIAESLPVGYKADEWENKSALEIYREIETINRRNEEILSARTVVEGHAGNIRKLEAEKQIETSALDKENTATITRLEKEIQNLLSEIEKKKAEIKNVAQRKSDQLKLIESEHELKLERISGEYERVKAFETEEIKDTSELRNQAQNIETMKGYVHEYNRMIAAQKDVERLIEESDRLTGLIEKARHLPGEILQKANVPIDGITVVDGTPLINGLPIGNLSDGEKLELCVNLAASRTSGLQIILLDGLEKLSDNLRSDLYSSLKKKGVQFIATRVTNGEFNVVEV